MKYSIGRPLKGHKAEAVPSRPGRTNRGTKLRCECGYERHVSNMPPSQGGRTFAQSKYQEHIQSVLKLPAQYGAILANIGGLYITLYWNNGGWHDALGRKYDTPDVWERLSPQQTAKGI